MKPPRPNRYATVVRHHEWGRSVHSTDPIWKWCGIIGAIQIAAIDQSFSTGLIWLFVCFLIGHFGSPAVERLVAHSRKWHFFAPVLLTWGLGIGPPVGSLFGIILTWVAEQPIPAIVGGILGMIVGVPFAALEGFIIASFVVGAYWIVTGKRLDAAWQSNAGR